MLKRIRRFLIKRRAALGGQAEHLLQLFPVIGHKGVAHLVQRPAELVDLGDEVFLVPEEQLRPHLIVDACNAGQVPEGISGVLAQRGIVVGAHQADGDGVAQLADIADHHYLNR